VIDSKKLALDEVGDAAEDFREMQHQVHLARERFIDTMVAAREANATQQEIAERCVIDPDDPEGEHLSRQRVAQFLKERKTFT
jgi:hypothetical protein